MALALDFQPVNDAADLFRRADRDLQKRMRQAANREITPWLASAIRRNGKSAVDRKLAGSARVRTGQNPAVVVPGRKLSGGATAASADIVRVYEFGGNRNARERYTGRSPRGTAYRVERHTQRMIPWSNKQGRFIYPAVADAAPMLVGAWVGLIGEMYTDG
jgi:hypothetical protein